MVKTLMRFTKQENKQKLNFDFSATGEWLPGTRLSVFLVSGSCTRSIVRADLSLYRLAGKREGGSTEAGGWGKKWGGGGKEGGRGGRKEGRI